MHSVVDTESQNPRIPATSFGYGSSPSVSTKYITQILSSSYSDTIIWLRIESLRVTKSSYSYTIIWLRIESLRITKSSYSYTIIWLRIESLSVDCSRNVNSYHGHTR